MAPRTQKPKARSDAGNKSWHHWLYHQLRVQIRLIVSIVVGIAVWLVLPLDDQINRILAGWNALGWLYIVLLLAMMMRAEVDGIKRQAAIEEESRSAALIIITLGAIAMFLAIVAQLSALGQEQGSIAPSPSRFHSLPSWCPGFWCRSFSPSITRMSSTVSVGNRRAAPVAVA